MENCRATQLEKMTKFIKRKETKKTEKKYIKEKEENRRRKTDKGEDKGWERSE